MSSLNASPANKNKTDRQAAALTLIILSPFVCAIYFTPGDGEHKTSWGCKVSEASAPLLAK